MILLVFLFQVFIAVEGWRSFRRRRFFRKVSDTAKTVVNKVGEYIEHTVKKLPSLVSEGLKDAAKKTVVGQIVVGKK